MRNLLAALILSALALACGGSSSTGSTTGTTGTTGTSGTSGSTSGTTGATYYLPSIGDYVTVTGSVSAYPTGSTQYQIAATQVTKLSSGNALPAAYQTTAANAGATSSSLKPYLGLRVQVQGALNFSSTCPGGTCSPCPAAFTYKTYCDGFSATDTSSDTVLIDTYAFLGNAWKGCTKPASINNATGIWIVSPDDKTSTVLALTDCGDLTGTPGYSGTGTPSGGAATIASSYSGGTFNLPASGVSGVVTAVGHPSSKTGKCTFVIQDPGSSPQPGSAIQVYATCAAAGTGG